MYFFFFRIWLIEKIIILAYCENCRTGVLSVRTTFVSRETLEERDEGGEIERTTTVYVQRFLQSL